MVGRVVLASGLLLALMAPGVAADMRFIDATLSAPTVAVETETVEFTATVAIDCATVLAAGSMGTTLLLNATADGHAQAFVITGPLSYAVDSATCIGATETRIPVQLSIAATRLAPGEVPIRIAVRAEVPSAGGPAVSASTTSTLEVEPFFLCEVHVATNIKQAGKGESISYAIEISNLGNTRANIVFSLPEDAAGGWDPVLPTTIVLEAEQQGGTTTNQTVDFIVKTPPDAGNREATFTLDLVSASTKSPDVQGPCGTVSVLARQRDFLGIPHVGLPAVLAALALAALVRRRD